MGKRYLTPHELGHGFEKRVKKAFERNGYDLVKMNQWKRNYDYAADHSPRREYDIVMFNRNEKQFYIIECKAHFSPDKYVDQKLVGEFNHKLKNYNGAYAYGVMVSDTDFTRAAKSYAEKNSIHLLNGNLLKKMEEDGKDGFRVNWAGATLSGLELLLDKIFKKD